MIFSSLVFLFWFIPIFFAVYYLVPQRAKNAVLFLGSIVFYAWGEPTYLILIFVSILINYLAGIVMEKFMHKGRTTVLVLALIFDFGMLGVFKYTGFFMQSVNACLGMSLQIPEIVLPLGISFYTFQIASYIIDLYKGKITCEKNILTLGTYLVMFPQLIAGPIVVYKQVAGELGERKITLETVEDGVGIFILGLASKVLVANSCGALWDEVAAIGYTNISMPLAWFAVTAFTFQIYFDFNGYSLMAIGLGKMLGFNLPKNFDHPYISLSLTEFWRRWHITLSNWFREYVYIPLGGNRKGKIRTYVNLFIVWLLTGFWHGAGWNFILWGLFFFVALSLEKMIVGSFLEKHRVFARFYSLILIGLSWMIFAITDFSDMATFFRSLVSMRFDYDIVYYLRNYGLITAIATILCIPAVSEGFESIRRRTVGAAVLLVLLLVSVAYLADAAFNPFLYFRF